MLLRRCDINMHGHALQPVMTEQQKSPAALRNMKRAGWITAAGKPTCEAQRTSMEGGGVK
jgi:hypothetical protein